MGVPVDFEHIHLDPLREDAETWESCLISILRNGVAIKGNVETRSDDPHIKSRNCDMRTRLDLFANIVQVASVPGIRARHAVCMRRRRFLDPEVLYLYNALPDPDFTCKI